MRSYLIIIEKAENNYSAYSPDLPGCITTGKSVEETKRNMQEAVEGHIRTLEEFGETVPDGSSIAEYVAVG
jgi:predicted RNase H-like HicB family nuclease